MTSSELNYSSLGLKGKVALVTGGSRGIGRLTVLALAEQGVNTVVNFVSDAGAAESAVRGAKAFGVDSLAISADVSKVSEAEQLVDEAIMRFSRIDFLICNAGIWEGAPVNEMSESLWDRVIDINLKGTWAICRATVPTMRKQKFGRIVIVSSTAGQRGEANVSNYAASKGGQISFTKSLAAELAGDGITVNSVAPGWVDTEMNVNVFADPERRRSIEKTIPLGRAASAEEIARPIVFLCSDWARHITGEILNVNGGSVLCG